MDKQKENTLNLDEIRLFIESLGYEVLEISQPWRYVSAVVNKDGNRSMFKICSAADLNMMMENELAWCERFQSNNFSTVKVPKVEGSGKYQDELSYMIVEYVDGQELSKEGEPANPDLLQPNFEKIAVFLKELKDLPVINFFPKDVQEIPKYVGRSLYSAAENWMKESEEDSEALLKFMAERRRSLTVSYMHGDLAPWHFMQNQLGELYVIDPEHGSTFGLSMYDSAYFFHRLYVVDSKAALEFLEVLRNMLKFSESDQQQFEFVLAARVAGGIWEGKIQKWLGLEQNMELMGKLLKNQL